MIIITPHNHITKYFKLKEVMCPCCCELIMDSLFYRHMKLLDVVREELGCQITINSGHRCIKHNREVGGAKCSMHLKFATDIRPSDGGKDKLDYLRDIVPSYFTGVGQYWSFVHVDLREHSYTWDNRNERAIKR